MKTDSFIHFDTNYKELKLKIEKLEILLKEIEDFQLEVSISDSQ